MAYIDKMCEHPGCRARAVRRYDSPIKQYCKKHIIHWSGVVSGNMVRYACNWAVHANSTKVTDIKRKVTCKNCLRILKNKVRE